MGNQLQGSSLASFKEYTHRSLEKRCLNEFLMNNIPLGAYSLQHVSVLTREISVLALN
jgi:hypothetical protein